jgi:hypothetical protein
VLNTLGGILVIWKKYQTETKLTSLDRMYYYYEFGEHIADAHYNGHKFWYVCSDADVYNTWAPQGTLRFMQEAIRVWKVYGGSIEVIKDRLNPPGSDINLEEFMLIKLSASKLN